MTKTMALGLLTAVVATGVLAEPINGSNVSVQVGRAFIDGREFDPVYAGLNAEIFVWNGFYATGSVNADASAGHEDLEDSVEASVNIALGGGYEFGVNEQLALYAESAFGAGMAVITEAVNGELAEVETSLTTFTAEVGARNKAGKFRNEAALQSNYHRFSDNDSEQNWVVKGSSGFDVTDKINVALEASADFQFTDKRLGAKLTYRF